MRLIATATVLGLAAAPAAAGGSGAAPRLEFNPPGTYSTFLFVEGGCEIVSYDPSNQRLYVVNGGEERIDVLDTDAEGGLTFAFSIDISSYGPSIQSVAVKNGLVAAAIGAAVETDPGTVAIFDLDGTPLHAFTTGVLPDMVGFSPDGRYVVTADEGQPNDDYTIDPPGGVTIVDLQAKGGPSAMVVTFESIDPAVRDVLSGYPEAVRTVLEATAEGDENLRLGAAETVEIGKAAATGETRLPSFALDPTNGTTTRTTTIVAGGSAE